MFLQPPRSTRTNPSFPSTTFFRSSDESGIGLTLLPVFYAHADFGGAPPTPGQRRFVSDIDCFARLVEASRALLPHDATIGIAPHSLRAVTADELKAVLPLAEGGPVHIPAAEQVKAIGRAHV